MIDGHPTSGPVFRVADGEPTPTPRSMNRAAVAEIAALDPDAVVVKGDLTSDGTDGRVRRLPRRLRAGVRRPAAARAGQPRVVAPRSTVADQPVAVASTCPGARIVAARHVGRRRGRTARCAADAARVARRARGRRATGRSSLFGHHHVWDPGVGRATRALLRHRPRRLRAARRRWSPGGPRSSATSPATPTATGCGASRPPATCRGSRWRA